MDDGQRKDANFHKIFWKNIEPLFKLSRKGMVAAKIMKMGSAGVPITLSVREMAKEFKVSVDTVQLVLNYMVKNDLVRRRGHRVIYTNPSAMYKGDLDNRMIALQIYRSIPTGKIDDIGPETGEVLNAETS